MTEFRVLPLGLHLETLGGIATPLMRRGTPLPAKRTANFSTADDEQSVVEIKVYLGSSPLVSHNLLIEKAMIGGITPKPRGEHQIRFTFSVDRSCKVAVSAAVDGKPVEIQRTMDSDVVVTDQLIKELLTAAEQHAASDKTEHRNLELRNTANLLLRKAEQEIEAGTKSPYSPTEYDRIDEAVASLGLELETGSAEEIEFGIQELEAALGERQSAVLNSFAGLFGSLGTPPSTKSGSSKPNRNSPPNNTKKPVEPPAKENQQTLATPEAAKVFVVHGRDENLRREFFVFLRALGLKPIEWSEALAMTGKGSPYIGQVLERAFQSAQAVVVLLSPDDDVRLVKRLWKTGESVSETTAARQPRANVLFEAGMAFGRNSDRTILVEVGAVRPFSDIAGRHTVRLDNSPERRADVADRLRTCGCLVSTAGRDWLSAGNLSLEASIATSVGSSPKS